MYYLDQRQLSHSAVSRFDGGMYTLVILGDKAKWCFTNEAFRNLILASEYLRQLPQLDHRLHHLLASND